MSWENFKREWAGQTLPLPVIDGVSLGNFVVTEELLDEAQRKGWSGEQLLATAIQRQHPDIRDVVINGWTSPDTPDDEEALAILRKEGLEDEKK
jgi:hypothetical protein